MLDPLHDRAVLHDLLRPPPGCRIERIIGTTYTLDLESLLGVCLVLTDLPWESEDLHRDALAPLVAVRRAVVATAPDRAHAPVITLACHAGGIHLPRTVPALAPWLERIVIPVLPPSSGGIFHPKVWLVRSRYEHGTIGWHAIIGSRNCTNDCRWDVGMRLDGRRDQRRRHATYGLAALVDALPGLARRAGTSLARAHIQALERDAHELQQFTFHLPDGGPAVPFHVHGLGVNDSRADILTSTVAKRILVMSPFVEKGFLNKLCKRHDQAPMTVISTTMSLNSNGHFSPDITTFELRGFSAPEVDATPGDGIAIPPAAEGLHAKLLAFEYGRHVQIVMGSANATTAAWGPDLDGGGVNIEVSAVFDVTMRDGSIDRLLSRTWKELLVPHLAEPESADRRTDRLLEDRLRSALADLVASKPRSTWQQDHANWAANLTLRQPWHKTVGVEISIRPLALPPNRSLGVKPKTTLRWVSVPLAQVGAWFVVRLATASRGRRLTWERVLLLPAGGLPTASRDAAALQGLLGTGQSLLRFLQLAVRAEGGGGSTRHATSHQNASTEANPLNIEDLLRASASADAIRIAELDGIIASATHQAATAILPPGFMRAWKALRDAQRVKA